MIHLDLTEDIWLIKQIDTNEADTKQASLQTQRDMLNLLTRVRARLENRKAAEIRQEIARE